MTLPLEALQSKLHLLPQRDRDFATSLLDQAKRRGLSDKQAPWIQRLLDRALEIESPKPAELVADMTPINDLFHKAALKLKKPAIVLAAEGIEGVLRLTPSRKYVGSVTVTAAPTVRSSFEDRDWLGTVKDDGTFFASSTVGNRKDATVAALRRFAADPVTGAKESARLTGRCCFCNLALTDARSTEVGYGSTCAENFGLPWGNRKAKAA